MTYTYGPVASWRYGRSLGVDITTPPKKCTFNCIYCQLGHTKRHLASQSEIMDELPASEDILSDVETVLKRIDQDTVDVITFSGTGEPTLNPNIGVIQSEIRKMVEEIPLVLLTNASLLPRKEVRKSLHDFDIITAKFDAGDEDTFKQINRPAKGTFSLLEIKEGITQLKQEMTGILALEVMLLTGAKGLTNIEGTPRKDLIDGIIDLNPDIVQIYTPWRPAAIQTTKPVSDKILLDFGSELEEYFEREKIWIYGVHDARGKGVKWKAQQVLQRDLLELLKRRPCRVSDIVISLGVVPAIAKNVLKELEREGLVRKRQIGSDVFFES